MPQRPVHRPRRLRPLSRILPSRVVKSLPLQARRSMHRRLPIRPAPKRRHRAVRKLHHQRRNHRRRFNRTIGIANIMHRLDRNRVRARAQLARHIGTHKLLPRHLPPRRKRLRRQHLHPIHPCRNRILSRRIQRRTPHRLIQRHRLPVNHTLLRRLLLA